MHHRRLLPNFSAQNAKASIVESPVKLKPSIDITVLTALATESLEDSHVYIHCYLENGAKDLLIRIWRTTFLIDQNTGNRSKLIHAENVSMAPQWTMVPNAGLFNFLLIFSPLPKSCQQFDLLEQVPTSGGFHIPGIQRNMKDVYHIDIK